ncbi:MAG: hypothetical protein ABSD75_25330 [Terriglobales bacterium]
MNSPLMFDLLNTFAGGADGSSPEAVLIDDENGNFMATKLSA